MHTERITERVLLPPLPVLDCHCPDFCPSRKLTDLNRATLLIFILSRMTGALLLTHNDCVTHFVQRVERWFSDCLQNPQIPSPQAACWLSPYVLQNCSRKETLKNQKLLSVKLASAQDMQARGMDLLILHRPKSKAYQQLSLTFEMFLIMSLRKYSQGDRTDWSSKEITLNDYNIIYKFGFFYFCKC